MKEKIIKIPRLFKRKRKRGRPKIRHIYIGFPPIKGRISRKRKWALGICYVLIGYGFGGLVRGLEFWLTTGYWLDFYWGLMGFMVFVLYYKMIAEKIL